MGIIRTINTKVARIALLDDIEEERNTLCRKCCLPPMVFLCLQAFIISFNHREDRE
jgi:hypothetical protein